MTSKNNKPLIYMFITIIFGYGLLNFIVPDKQFSERENRNLKPMPELTVDNVISGKFAKDFEGYFQDHFVFKGAWVYLKSDLERAMQKKENNGVYFGKDDYLLEKYSHKGEQFENNVEIINNFAENNNRLNIFFLLAPNSVDIKSDKLPAFADPYNQEMLIQYAKEHVSEEVAFVDANTYLNKYKNEYIYYRTDHHWTTLGAYYAYKAFGDAANINIPSKEDYRIEEVANDFKGTFFNKANNRFIEPDTIEIWNRKNQPSYTVNYDDTDEQTNTIYAKEHLNTADKYAMFTDGNHSLIKIKTESQSDKKILIIKDSYANSFVPFLLSDYKEIHIVDLRFYFGSISKYMEENKINNMLAIYNVSTFGDDMNIIKLK